ncbi:MAG: amino acid permease, partial [Clostridiales Family XIII bacterium]|nr:amino acid permease [Clostridiales Family XIII bacterium]
MSNEQVPEKRTTVSRSIKSRQLSMIAIGGSIGTGIFFASGNNIASIGPGGSLVLYIVIGVIVYFMMQCLGEMATNLPISGSFSAYAGRVIDPALGFAFGWNYWIAWAITIAVEFTAGAAIMTYWIPESVFPGWAWSVIFFVFLLGLNLFSVKGFAEAEYWFASIKVVVIILVIIVGFLVVFNVFGNSPGVENWTQTGSDGTPLKGPFFGGFGGALTAFLVVGYSFQGTELVGIAAAETDNPAKSIPKAVRSVFWRLLIFYIGSIVVVAFLIPSSNENLLSYGVEEVAKSPFTLLMKIYEIPYADHVMNAVVLTSVLSCGNSCMYSASRMLYALAKEKQAPKVFTYTSKTGVPLPALLASAAMGAFSFLCTLIGLNKLYLMLLNASAVMGFIVWLGIAVSQYRFRKAWIVQGRKVEDMKFRSKFYPVAPIVATVAFIIIIFGANYWTFYPEFLPFDFVTSYLFIPIFAGLYFGFKFYK